MAYVVRWVKDGERHGLFLREATTEQALAYARALLEIGPSDIWIESLDGSRFARSADILTLDRRRGTEVLAAA